MMPRVSSSERACGRPRPRGASASPPPAVALSLSIIASAMLLHDACHSIDNPNMRSILENVKFPNYPLAPRKRISTQVQGDRPTRKAVMSRHTQSFEAADLVPTETAHELLPLPDQAIVTIPAAPQGRSVKDRVRRLLLAGAAVAVLAGAGWYGFDYWTVGRFLVSTD